MFDRYLLLILFSICSVCLHCIIMATDYQLTIADALVKPKYDRESKCSIAISSTVWWPMPGHVKVSRIEVNLSHGVVIIHYYQTITQI